MAVPPGNSTGAPLEFVVDQQIRQVQNVQALQPINGPQYVGVDGSKTPPQVSTMVSPMDGELPRPSTVGNDFYRKAREIRRDPTIRLVRELSMAPLLMAEWEYEVRPDAPQGAKELITEVMNEMRLRLMRTSLCGACDYGWQPYEIIAEQRRDGASTVRLKPLLQDITSILVNAADGSFFGLRQTPMIGLRIGWIYLLDQECFVVSQDVEGTNWYGEPTLRSVERTYDESQVIAKNARKYDQKIAGTHWVIYFPIGTSNFDGKVTDNGEVARQLLQQAEAVGGIMVPRSVIQITDALNAALANSEAAQWKIELLSDKGQGQTPFIEKLKYLDVLKVRAFGFPERSVLEGQFGTKAEAESHADIAVSNLEVRHSLLTEQYNQKIVDTVLKWNYGPDAGGAAWIKPSPLADDKLAFFQKLYETLFANPQGFMTETSQIDMEQVRERLGLPTYDWEKLQQQAQQWGAWDPYSDPYGQGITSQFQSQPQSEPGSTSAVNIPYALPQTFSYADDVRDAADRTHPSPSKKQIDAGNYRKGKVTLHGMRVSIENPRGTVRKAGWKPLSAHYGYIKRTEGSDGDHVDCFVGPHPESELVHVVDQVDKDGQFDEHKVMLGYNSLKKARKAYKKNYPKSHRVGPITAAHVTDFRSWLENGDTTRPFASSMGLAYDPDEARDEKGQWTHGGGAHDDWESTLTKDERYIIDAWAGREYERLRAQDDKGKNTRELQILISACSKAPLYKGIAYRGMRLGKKEFEELKPGEIMHVKGITSFSKSDVVAKGFARSLENDGKINVLIKAKVKSGRYLGDQAGVTNEQEVAVRREKFKIKKIKRTVVDGDPLYVVEAA